MSLTPEQPGYGKRTTIDAECCESVHHFTPSIRNGAMPLNRLFNPALIRFRMEHSVLPAPLQNAFESISGRVMVIRLPVVTSLTSTAVPDPVSTAGGGLY